MSWPAQTYYEVCPVHGKIRWSVECSEPDIRCGWAHEDGTRCDEATLKVKASREQAQ